MKLFTAEDFFPYFSLHPNTNMTGAMAELANAKLMKDAKVVYGTKYNDVRIGHSLYIK